MTALDTLVVTTALPVLRVDLHAGLSGLEWTVNAYNLSFACLLLTGAALGDRFGRKTVFVAGLTLFSVASALSATAGSVGMLVFARMLQGGGAAIVMPLSLTLITEAFPAEKRAAAIGMWGGIVGFAVAAGPLVGGAVVAGLSWHWMFWLNVPVGGAVAPLAWRYLGESYGPNARLDLSGLALAGVGALGLTWGLVRAGTTGWASGEVIAALTGGALGVALFLVWEWHRATPMLPLALFRSRTFTATNAVSFFMYAGLFGALFMMSQLLQNALGYSPLQAGLRLLPWTAPPVVIAPLAGTLAARYGNRPFMVLGLLLQAGGFGWIAAMATIHISYVQLGLAFTVAGIGTSLCFPTVAGAVMGSVPLPQAGIASGTNSAMRELGGVFGVAVLSSVFARTGVYSSPVTFMAGFRAAIWVAVAFSAIGVVAAAVTAGRAHTATPEQLPVIERQPVLVSAG
jgi:EmrB/QacA subfamily drug resistance transporter